MPAHLDAGLRPARSIRPTSLPYAAAERNGLVADDGQRQNWATIRSGLGAGLHNPVDLDVGRSAANERMPGRQVRGRRRAEPDL